MAHQITATDSMFTLRRPPWHGLGAVLDESPASVQDALVASGLDWKVEQEPVYVKQLIADPNGGDYQKEIFVPLKDAGDTEYRANIRNDNRAVLGVVSDDYKVVQNADGFAFMDALLGNELDDESRRIYEALGMAVPEGQQVVWETAGSLQGGKRVWVLVRRPDVVEIAGDECVPYLYVANAHDGSMAVTAGATTIRIVCANTLGATLRQADHGAQAARTFRFRHTGNLTAKFAEARRVIGMTIRWEKEFKDLGDRLGQERLTLDAFDKKVVQNLFPIDEDKMGKRAITNRENAREQILNIFRGQGPEGDTTGNAPGTAWCGYNAATEWMDWSRRYTKRTNQVQRSFEDFAPKEQALALITAAVG